MKFLATYSTNIKMIYSSIIGVGIIACVFVWHHYAQKAKQLDVRMEQLATPETY